MFFRLIRRLIAWGWPMRLLSPWFGHFHPFMPDYNANPYPRYRALRRQDPVHFHRVMRIWVLTRHADVANVLKDPRFSVQRLGTPELPAPVDPTKGLSPELAGIVRKNLLMLDPPDHTRIRNLVNKAFTPRRVERLRPRIQAVVDEVLDGIAPGDEIDLVEDFAVPIPIIVIAEMLGVEASDRERFKAWSTVLSGLLDPLGTRYERADFEASFAELSAYFDGVFQQRRGAPRDDLISALVAAEEAGDKLDASELLSVCFLILGAGHETTTNLIGNAFVAMLRNPIERKRLTADPTLMESAVEEFLRYDSPVQITDRRAMEDLEIDGRKIARGQFVLLCLGAANHDPTVFDDPERLDLGRTENRHLAFSQGAHFCLGAQLARVETQIAIRSFLDRFPDFEGPRDPRGWRRSTVLHGPISLPIRV